MKLIILQTNMGDSFMYLIIVVVVLIGLFFILRGINLWYWKINEIVDNQKSIIRLLTKLNGDAPQPVKQKPDLHSNPIQMLVVPDGHWLCKECNQVNPDSEIYCKKCKFINPSK